MSSNAAKKNHICGGDGPCIGLEPVWIKSEKLTASVDWHLLAFGPQCAPGEELWCCQSISMRRYPLRLGDIQDASADAVSCILPRRLSRETERSNADLTVDLGSQ